MNPTNPQFINSVRAGLQHWLAQTADESEAHILWLDGERLNLMRVLDYGRELPQLRPQTAQLILQCFTLVERRGYGKEWIPIMRQAADNWAGDDDRLRCQILIRLGYLHQLNRQIDTALTIHRQAEQLAQQLDDLYLFSHTHHNLAIDYREKHQYDQAEFYGQLARSGFVECGDNYRLAITLNDLG
ncbi:MAG: tetratricopeptide repeat protein, partial [Chloroflexi bacterium]|nr:tetratricopeptide repeat protein [Chloroflexota bacterium]